MSINFGYVSFDTSRNSTVKSRFRAVITIVVHNEIIYLFNTVKYYYILFKILRGSLIIVKNANISINL